MISRANLLIVVLLLVAQAGFHVSARAQSAAPAVAGSAAPVIPSFIDPNFRIPRPDLSARPRLRFLTVTDFPPFSFIDERKRLTGFHVDLSREICRTLGLLDVCQIQAVPLAELEATLLAGDGELALAGIRPTQLRREKLDFSKNYFRLPARFATKASSGLVQEGDDAIPFVEKLAGQDVGIVDGTAHAAFAKTWFGDAKLRVFNSRDNGIKALREGAITAFFGDALQLSFLMQESGPNALAFAGPPYFSPVYFASDLSVAMARGDDELRDGVDFALAAIFRDGRFEELYLRYFPVGLF